MSAIMFIFSNRPDVIYALRGAHPLAGVGAGFHQLRETLTINNVPDGGVFQSQSTFPYSSQVMFEPMASIEHIVADYEVRLCVAP